MAPTSIMLLNRSRKGKLFEDGEAWGFQLVQLVVIVAWC